MSLHELADDKLYKLIDLMESTSQPGAEPIFEEARRRLYFRNPPLNIISDYFRKDWFYYEKMLYLTGKLDAEKVNRLEKYHHRIGGFINNLVTICAQRNKDSNRVDIVLQHLNDIDINEIENYELKEIIGYAIEGLNEFDSTSDSVSDCPANECDNLAKSSVSLHVGRHQTPAAPPLPSAMSKISERDFRELCIWYEHYSDEEKLKIITSGVKYQFKILKEQLAYEALIYLMKHKVYFDGSFNELIYAAVGNGKVSDACLDDFLKEIKDWFYSLDGATDFVWSIFEHGIRRRHMTSGKKYMEIYMDNIVDDMIQLLERNDHVPFEELIECRVSVPVYEQYYDKEIRYFDKKCSFKLSSANNSLRTGNVGRFDDVLLVVLDHYYCTIKPSYRPTAILTKWEYPDCITLFEHYNFLKVNKLLDHIAKRGVSSCSKFKDNVTWDKDCISFLFGLKYQKWHFNGNDYRAALFLDKKEPIPLHVSLRFFSDCLHALDFSDDSVLKEYLSALNQNHSDILNNHYFYSRLLDKLSKERDEFGSVWDIMKCNFQRVSSFYIN